MAMTVAIVHYHLGPGGVSHVIAAASQCLSEAGTRHVILVDSPPEGPAHDMPVRIVSGLGYRSSSGGLGASELLERLRSAAREALGAPPDIWHFHNHALGKNPLLPEVVALLAEADERIVLQIHDLAEDGRPANYQVIADCGNLYPVSPRIHYAFLNSRDLRFFQNAGLPMKNASVIANPVVLPGAGGRDESRAPVPILFAPIRGIRRKNLGELVFLSALARGGACFAASRAPLNPDALAIHDTWSRFAQRQGLPIGFDVVGRFSPTAGAAADFDSWLAHASHIVTTSVSEGFGLSFLEAAALGKPLIGRNLPHITAEHTRHGIHAGDLYDRLLVPVEWVDRTILLDHLGTTLERNHRAYRRPLTRRIIAETNAALIDDGWLDFGNLPESLQQGIIERLADPHCRKTPLVEKGGTREPAEDWLAAAIANRAPTATADQLAPYSIDRYRETLAALYSDLSGRQPSSVCYLSSSEILDAHLGPASFHFLLSAPPPPATSPPPFRAVVFDIYGTLLIAPAGGVKPDPDADPALREILRQFGHETPESPSTGLHAAVLRHHAASSHPFPEIDLRQLWREVLSLEPDTDTSPLVLAIEAAWHPSRPMPGAAEFVQRLSRAGVSLGLLSNAQCNTLRLLGGMADLFAPELTLLSYHHGIAKPAPELFEMLINRLEGRGISPAETLFIGNDPLQDIRPAAAAGFKTALFTGHPDSIRHGDCAPDYEFKDWENFIPENSTKPGK